MALQMSFTSQYGIDFPTAYVRIDTFRGDRNTVRLGLGVYVSKDARDAGKPAIAVLDVTMPTPNTNENMFASVYAHLKTLPEFSETIDV